MPIYSNSRVKLLILFLINTCIASVEHGDRDNLHTTSQNGRLKLCPNISNIAFVDSEATWRYAPHIVAEALMKSPLEEKTTGDDRDNLHTTFQNGRLKLCQNVSNITFVDSEATWRYAPHTVAEALMKSPLEEKTTGRYGTVSGQQFIASSSQTPIEIIAFDLISKIRAKQCAFYIGTHTVQTKEETSQNSVWSYLKNIPKSILFTDPPTSHDITQDMKEFPFLVLVEITKYHENIIKLYKDLNPTGKIIVINKKVPPFLSDNDFIIIGNVSEILQIIAEELEGEC